MANNSEGILSKSHLHLRLLGRFEARVQSTKRTQLSAKKAQVLVAYLALHPDQHVARDKIASMLWSDTANEFSRTNLRQCLAVLRKAFAHSECPCIVNVGNSIYLDRDYAASDVEQFESYCDQSDIGSLEKAINLYQGEFLAGVDIDSERMGRWLNAERQRLCTRQSQAFNALLDHYKKTSNVEREISIAQSQLALDPTLEIAHRSLIHCYGIQGRSAEALEQFDLCKRTLHEALDESPDAETQRLYNQQLRSLPRTNVKDQLFNVQAACPTNPELIERLQTDSSHVDNSVASPNRHIKKERRLSFLHRCLHRVTLFCRSMASNPWFIGGLLVTLVVTSVHFYTAQSRSETLFQEALYRVPPVLIPSAKPSVAVLPFVNLSHDPQQAYFSDGLTEDLITDLSQVSGILVVARASSFEFRESPPNLQQIAEKLGVRFIVVGSVRKIGYRVRVNAQLINVDSGLQLWANRYDRESSDILFLQDEITRTIVSAMSISLTQNEQERFARSSPIDPDAYDLLLRGLGPVRRIEKQASAEARTFFQRAIDLDPDYARAYANLALSYGQEVVFRLTDNPAESIQLGLNASDRAQKLNASLPQVHFARSVLYLAQDKHAEAVASAYSALESDPNYADGYAVLAQTLSHSGKLAAAMTAIQNAKLLNPLFPFTYIWVEAHILFLQGEFAKSANLLEQVVHRNPPFVAGHSLLAAAYGMLGELDGAEWEIAELLTLMPDFSLKNEIRSTAYLKTENLNQYIDGLRRAGLPD